MTFDVGIVGKPMVVKGFGLLARRTRACGPHGNIDRDSCHELILDQRMCTAWYYSTGMEGGGRCQLAWDGMSSYGKQGAWIIYEFPSDKPGG